MAPTTADMMPNEETPRTDAPCLASVSAGAEQYLAARLARWLADVAIASVPSDEELDDAG
jgi:hypothetical protein